MKLIHCACGFKFHVAGNSKVMRCYKCVNKTKRISERGKKPLDVAFSKLDEILSDKKEGAK